MKLTATGGQGPPSHPLDAKELRRAFELLPDPEHACQLFTLPGSRKETLPGKDIDGLVQAAQKHGGQENVYIVLNPLPLGQTDYAKNGNIVKRRWLFIDIDPFRAEGFDKHCASEIEHDLARQGAESLRDYLSARGWPAPVVIDSGNGWYLLYRIDLPNEPITTALIKKFLLTVGKLIDDNGIVDIKVSDARRIARLPGTWNRGRVQRDDRVWRPCRLVYTPQQLEIVSAEMITEIAGVDAPRPQLAQKSSLALRAGSSRANACVRRAIDLECSNVATAPPGQRNDRLNRAAFSLAGFIGPGYATRGEIEQRLFDAAHDCGLADDPNCGERGIRATITSGIEAGIVKPRIIGDNRATPGQQHATGGSASNSVPDGESIIVRASSITPRRVEWLWPGRIPLGKLTTFAGIGGLGKTFVLCDITARVTRGLDWPHSGGECAEPGQVLFVSGEDDSDDTLVPRLIEMGADLERVIFLRTEVQDRFLLSDLKTLDKALEQAGPGVRFVAIDPPTAYLGGVDDHKNAELRSLLSPLKSWAAKQRVAMVFNTHVNKASGQKVDAMMRVMGSVAWVNAVRAAHMFARDPEDPERRLFVGMKLNIGKEVKGLSYRIADTDKLARVEWIGEVDTTADEAMNREKRKRRGVKAAEWLGEFFQGTDQVESNAIWKSRKDTDLSENAVKEAKEDMGIRARQNFDPETGRTWFWYWPESSRRDWERRNAPNAIDPDVDF